MRIGIDISQIIYGTGVSMYTRNLVKALLGLNTNDTFVLFGGSLRRLTELTNILSDLSRMGRCETKAFPVPPALADLVWNRLHAFEVERLVGKLDVFHSSDWTQPPTSAYKVTTVHDMVPIIHPELSDPKIVNVHKTRFKWVQREVDNVIVPTKRTARDANSAGIEAKRIVVIPEAVDFDFVAKSSSIINKVKRKYGINGKYLLSIGVSPRKNTERILAAFGSVKEQQVFKLVFVGHPYIKTNKQKNVIYLGHVARSDLPALYSGSEVLVYPTLYEGFGLPILEAFACKTPVVTSKGGSTAEVAGKAAVLVDPESEESIIEGINDAIKNKRSLVKKGLMRVKRYNWEKTARDTLNIYRLAE